MYLHIMYETRVRFTCYSCLAEISHWESHLHACKELLASPRYLFKNKFVLIW